MKKKSDSRIVKFVTNIFNFRWWIDYDRLRAFALYFLGGFKKLFVPQKNTGSTESFEEAMRRMKLTEEDLAVRQTSLYRLSLLMCILASLIFLYTLYLLFYGTVLAVFVSTVVMCLALVLAFRYHFWYYQIKNRKLGCSLLEWYRKGLLGGP